MKAALGRRDLELMRETTRVGVRSPGSGSRANMIALAYINRFYTYLCPFYSTYFAK